MPAPVYTYIDINSAVSGLASTATVSGTAPSPPNTGAPAVTLSPSPLTFTARPVNSTSLPAIVTLTNSGTGNAPLTLSGISIQGAANNNFTQTNNCPSSLATGASCNISVTFAPTFTGTQSATLQVLSNASTSPDTMTISGSTQ